MNPPLLLSFGALTVVAAVGLSPAAAASSTDQVSPTVVSIREDGVHDIPVQWFDDAVVVPGDQAERTIIVRNDRDLAVDVDIAIDDVRPAGGALLRDLVIDWGVGSATAAEVAASPASTVSAVTLDAGEELDVRLAYAYPEDHVTPPGAGSVSFDVLIRASADDGTGDDGSGDGSGPDGWLAGTGGDLESWPAVAALLLAGAGATLWVFGGRRGRRDVDPETGSGESAAV